MNCILLILALASMASTVNQIYTFSAKTAAAQPTGASTLWSFSNSNYPLCNFTNGAPGIALNAAASPISAITGFANSDTFSTTAGSSAFSIGSNVALAVNASVGFSVSLNCTSPPKTITYTLNAPTVFPSATVTFTKSGSEKIAAFALVLLLLL